MLKKPMTLDEQLKKLENQGILIVDKDKAKRILTEIHYYRFTGYALQYRIDEHKSSYIDGVTFENIYNIYMFDKELRDVLHKYIECVEVYYRSLISYHFSIAKCMDSPHDQHYDENNFYNKAGYAKIMDDFINKEQNYYIDSLIVKHHKQKYNNKMPLWVIVELMSFSHVSMLYSAMYNSEKDLISAAVGTKSQLLKNHLHCLSVLRNKCAHAARLYNTEFNPPAKFNSNFLRKNPEIRNNSLFAYIMVLIMHLPDVRLKETLILEIKQLVNKYKVDIDLEKIGFPEQYEKYSRERISQFCILHLAFCIFWKGADI